MSSLSFIVPIYLDAGFPLYVVLLNFEICGKLREDVLIVTDFRLLDGSSESEEDKAKRPHCFESSFSIFSISLSREVLETVGGTGRVSLSMSCSVTFMSLVEIVLGAIRMSIDFSCWDCRGLYFGGFGVLIH